MTSGIDLFRQINNAVLDLQSAQLQTFQLPLKTLARLLTHPDLLSLNNQLTEGVDLDAFLERSNATQGGMVGSATLLWPDDDRERLGLTLMLILKCAEDPDELAQLAHRYFHSGRKIIDGIHAVTGQMIIPFVRNYKERAMNAHAPEPRLVRPVSKRVFIVHGHDGEARETLARTLGQIGLEPIILHEQANRGRTIIEKVEANSDVGFAVVLLTPDDVGRAAAETDTRPRPRQNVLLELGYFIGLLGRDRVCALRRGEVDVPSDFAGVVWTDMDAGGGWRLSLARELAAAGHDVHVDRLLG